VHLDHVVAPAHVKNGGGDEGHDEEQQILAEIADRPTPPVVERYAEEPNVLSALERRLSAAASAQNVYVVAVVNKSTELTGHAWIERYV
jgi:hypothetical protein